MTKQKRLRDRRSGRRNESECRLSAGRRQLDLLADAEARGVDAGILGEHVVEVSTFLVDMADAAIADSASVPTLPSGICGSLPFSCA